MQSSQTYEINNNVEASPSSSKTVNLPPLLQTESGQRGNHHGKSRVSRNAKSRTQKSNAGNCLLDYEMYLWNSALVDIHRYLFSPLSLDGLSVVESPNSAAVNNCRYDSSLGMSTLIMLLFLASVLVNLTLFIMNNYIMYCFCRIVNQEISQLDPGC